MSQQATKEKYSIETLRERNVSYDHQHWLTQEDVDMVNSYVELIERTRSEIKPQIGDRLVYVTEHGDYYGNALIDAVCPLRLGRKRKHPSECQRGIISLCQSEGFEIPEMDGGSLQGLGTLRGVRQRNGGIHGKSAVVVLCRTQSQVRGLHDRNLPETLP